LPPSKALIIRPGGAGINILLERVDILDKAGMDILDRAGMDILDKAAMDILDKSGIAANITYNASHAARNTGHTVADTTEFLPNMGRNNPVPVHHGRLEQTNIKA
jgi:isopentenyl phosphate kinase